MAAFSEKKLVGNCDIFRRKMKDVHHTGVLGIVILEGYRGVGLGEAMMLTALAQATKVGIWLVELQVFANNKQARALYEKLGFRMVGLVPNKIVRRGKSIDEVVMYADLRPTDKSSNRRRTRR